MSRPPSFFSRHPAGARLALGLWIVTRLLFSVDAALPPNRFETQIHPLIKEYCIDCHSAEKHKGDLDLEQFKTDADALKQPKVWQGFIEQLSLGEMPPKDKPQPAQAQRETLLAWASALLDEFALAHAGDPGPVVLRRLSNAEYTYTLRDLTRVDSLDPAAEFPADSASGEGFMNVGQSLVMSPSLVTKYLDAAKSVARHAVLLPDGLRFSPHTTRRDWTEELLAEIRSCYAEWTENGGGSAVNLQGIKFDTRDGGVLPLEAYLAASIDRRNQLPNATPTPTDAKTGSTNQLPPGLNPKYFHLLWTTLTSPRPSLLLDPIRARWRQADRADARDLAEDIARWQSALWKFNSVGHIGKLNGPSGWMEPVSPLQSSQELRLKPAAAAGGDCSIFLAASDAGDGRDGDYVVWQDPRFVAPGKPDLLLRDARAFYSEFSARRDRYFDTAARCLNAAASVVSGSDRPDIESLARRHRVDPVALKGWLDYLEIGPGVPVVVEGLFTNRIDRMSGYDFIRGWGSPETPNLVANASDQSVRIPGTMKPRSIAVHPSPKLAAAVGWLSPFRGSVRIAATVQPAHPECGNGITWTLERRRGTARHTLAAGTAQGGKPVSPPPIENQSVHPGDLISLVIGARDANHACDLTAVDLEIRATIGGEQEWSLARDVSPQVLTANPHADGFGNERVWFFYVETDKPGIPSPAIPPGSLLAEWVAEPIVARKQALAKQIQELLTTRGTNAANSADTELYRQLASPNGPLLRGDPAVAAADRPSRERRRTDQRASQVGIDPALFGKHPNGTSIPESYLCVQAPSLIEIRLPAELVEGREFVTTGTLHRETGAHGSVQLRVLTNRPSATEGLIASAPVSSGGKGTWTDADRPVLFPSPIVVLDQGPARLRIEAALDEFRQLFPAALCYTKIVPVDEVVTLTLYHREDHHFARLLLDPPQAAKLDRLWDELHYVSQDALTLVDAFEQLWQYATQDADPKVFEPMRGPITERAAAYRKRLELTQPRHLEAVLNFAESASRRPLETRERDDLRSLYRRLIGQELPHEEAIRLLLARVLVSPSFLYRAEKPGPGPESGPVNDWELATRLSYFLWASAPDEELRAMAARGALRDPKVLVAQARRMLRDPRVRRLATEFACAWLHIYDFDELGEKSDRHFPTFADLRAPMYEETILFFMDLFQQNGSVLDILDADYTFLNEALAKHYGIPDVTGSGWRRVTGVKRFSRGGILAQATTLAKQSGASRTSPILRGNWLCEVLLGDKLPRPPKDVPRLPEDEATESLTVRQLVEKHSSDPNCMGCHRRIDPFGYALEGFDAIGRRRETDLGGRPVDTRAKTLEGAAFEGLDGLRTYLLTKRRDAFVKQFSRKLLGYALGRSVQISDTPLISEIRSQLQSHDHHISTAIETIVQSRQFREIRGQQSALNE